MTCVEVESPNRGAVESLRNIGTITIVRISLSH